jgi:hypothetical protein
MAVLHTEWRIEGQAEDGTWHTLAIPGREGDHLAHRNVVIELLRAMGVTGYRRVRLAKYVTTIEIIGEDIKV